MKIPSNPIVSHAQLRIAQYRRIIEREQEQCDHAYASRTPKSNTGNYDPSADAYWYDCYCPVCCKRWIEDQ